VHLVGHTAPLLFLGRHELTEQVLEPALTVDQLRGTLGDLLFEGFVEPPNLLLGLLTLGDVLDLGDEVERLPAAVADQGAV
jgi:hypothetical protein